MFDARARSCCRFTRNEDDDDPCPMLSVCIDKILFPLLASLKWMDDSSPGSAHLDVNLMLC